MITPAQRALTLREALEAHFDVSLPGAEVMIEQTISAAMAITFDMRELTMCPESERPCGFPGACAQGCMLRRG